MYSVLFAHPLVEAITTWDFTDGCWLGAPSGLLRQDNSVKPAYEALKALIHGNWETHAHLTTDAEGRLDFTGFKGEYTLSCRQEKASVSLHDDIKQNVTLG